MEKEPRLRSISARAAMVAKAAVAQEWTYMKACLHRQVHYFRVRRHSGTIAKVIRRTNSPVVHYTAKGLSPCAHYGDGT